MRIVEFFELGVIVKARLQPGRSVAYGEILTAERLPGPFGLRLHTRTSDPLRLRCRGTARMALENELRRHGVRIVDEYGALITPTLDDFEAELARGPERMRQSSDNA